MSATLPVVQEQAPVLHDFVASEMLRHRNALPSAATRLLKRLLELAEAAYVPAAVDSYRSCSRRTRLTPVHELPSGLTFVLTVDHKLLMTCTMQHWTDFCTALTESSMLCLMTDHCAEPAASTSDGACEEEIFLRSGHYFPTLPHCRNLRRSVLSQLLP